MPARLAYSGLPWRSWSMHETLRHTLPTCAGRWWTRCGTSRTFEGYCASVCGITRVRGVGKNARARQQKDLVLVSPFFCFMHITLPRLRSIFGIIMHRLNRIHWNNGDDDVEGDLDGGLPLLGQWISGKCRASWAWGRCKFRTGETIPLSNKMLLLA